MKTVIVSTVEGKVRGKMCTNFVGEDFYAFLGVPYAKAPIGDLRFKAPRDPEKWTEVKDATKDGPPCPSRHLIGQFYIGKEDNCLNLNVFTKKVTLTDSEKPKPVMVFIHGGGFTYGNNKPEFYGPEFLLWQDIVLVVINYRIGIMGFLALEDPSLDVPGNAGLKDQVMALKWVQRNIINFGGDPNNVTIFGQSAGSVCAHLLMLSPVTKGLFHKVILESASALCIWAKGYYNAKVIGELMGYTETNEKLILDKLNKSPIQDIIKGQYKFYDDLSASKRRPFGPVIEKASKDAFLTEDPVEIIKSGNYHKLPLMIGYTTKEGILFDIVRKSTPNVKLPKSMDTEVPFDLDVVDNEKKHIEIKSRIKKTYFKDEMIKENNIDYLYTLKTDIGFKYPIYKSIDLHRSIHDKPIYFYVFSHEGPLNLAKNYALRDSRIFQLIFLMFAALTQGMKTVNKLFHDLLGMMSKKYVNGASHCDELSYLFLQKIHPPFEPDEEEDYYIKRLVKLWTNFARHGNPTPQIDEVHFNKALWKPVSKDEMNYLNIGNELRMEQNPDQDMCTFWDNIYEFCDKKI